MLGVLAPSSVPLANLWGFEVLFVGIFNDNAGTSGPWFEL